MARSAGYRREGTLGFNTETSRAHSNTHKQATKQTLYYLLAPFLLTDASCPSVQTAQLQHHVDTRSVSLQVDLQARWKGRPALWFLSSFIFCYCWIPFHFDSVQTERATISVTK